MNWDTFRYRNYDIAIGRFMGIDPITEVYMSISPYQFAHNNPVWKVEIEGLEGQPTTNIDIINREPIYMTRNIIVNTMNIQSSKPQNSRPGVPILQMGLGVENSSSTSVGCEFAQANGTATAYKANIGLAICIEGEKIEYGLTLGRVSGDASVNGQNLVEEQFITFDAQGSYNMRNGDQTLDIQTATGGISGGGNEESELTIEINTMGAYIKANLTEIGNNFLDFGNLIMSYMQGMAEDYFNSNSTSDVKLNPVR